jgi:hypothetical protein
VPEGPRPKGGESVTSTVQVFLPRSLWTKICRVADAQGISALETLEMAATEYAALFYFPPKSARIAPRPTLKRTPPALPGVKA